MALVRVTGSPSITAGGFDVADAVGTQIQFNSSANAGSIVGCRVLDKGRQSVPLELWLFRATTTGSGLGNNEAFAPSDGQIANLAAVVRVWTWFAAAGNSIGQAENLPLSFADLTSGVLYGWLVCRGRPTYASGDLIVELELEQGASPISRRRLYYRKRRYPPLTTLDVTPAENFHTIHLKFTCSLQPADLPPSTVKITGSYLLNGRWVEFHPAMLDDASANTLYTILFGLEEDKTYPVKIEFKRINNATGALIERKTYYRIFKTRKSPVSANALTKYVANNGNDTTGNGDYDTPYKTLNKAATVHGGTAGLTIVMKNGTYGRATANGGYDFSTSDWSLNNLFSGASGAYDTIRAETPGQVIISGKTTMTTENDLGEWTRDIAPGRTFNGTSTWLGNITGGTSLLSHYITASAGTVAGWIKVRGTPPTNANAYGLDCIFADTSGFAGLFVGTITGDPDGARVWASNWDGTQDKCDGAYTANTWTHVAWVHGGGTLKLYINGTLANSVASGNTSELGNRIRFGLRNTEYFEGAMSLWGAWNIALSDGDISSLAAGSDPNQVQAASLKGRWPINGASPETETIQGHNLTVNGSAGTETGPTLV